MAVYIIPIANASTDQAFYFTVDLDGEDYRFDFQYNDREGFWYFDILDSEGTHVKSGIKVVSNFPVLRLLAERTQPPGMISFVDTRELPADPGEEDLGVNVELSYMDEAELAT